VSSILAAAFALCLALPAASQTFIYVSNTGLPGVAGDCANPVDTIAEGLALAAAAGGTTEVRVAGGTYGEATLTVDFSDVSIKGGYDPAGLGGGCDDVAAEAARDATAFTTTIDAGAAAMQDRIFDVLPNIDETDPMNPVFLSSNANITFDGLVMTNGIPMRMLANGEVGGGAGAMLVLNCDNVVLSNNVFRDNRSNSHGFVGGAVYFATYATAAGVFNPGTMILDANLFEDNTTGDGSGSSGWGGGFAARDFNNDGASIARGTVVNATGNVFRGNVSQGSINLAPAGLCDPNQDCAPVDGAADTCAVQAIGGGVYLENTLGVWQGNLFDNNSARPVPSLRFDQTGWGGGLASLSAGAQVTGGASPAIVENTFLNNTASAGLGDVADCGWLSAWGGGLFLSNFDNQVVGNFMQGNRAESTLQQRAPYSARGGAIFIAPTGTLSGGQLATIDNNTFEGNSAEAGGSWIGAWGGAVHVNDQFGNVGDPVITNNTFTANRAFTDSSYYRAAYGGGLQVSATGNYPLIARNVFDGNMAERSPAVRGAIVALGGAAHFRMQTNDGVVAENTVRGNTASSIDDTPPNPNLLSFSGFVFGLIPFDSEDNARAPLVQNNLIVDNGGVGLSVQGLWVDGANDEPDDDADTPNELYIHGPRLVNNTIANNTGVGLVTNLMDGGTIDSNIVWGNDGNGANFGNWFDNWLCSSGDGVDNCLPRPSVLASVQNNVLQDFPAIQMDAVIDPITMLPANGNVIGADPAFLDGLNPDPLLRDYHLQQAPDQGVTSPAVDAGPIGAIARDYSTERNSSGRDVDGDGDPDNDNLFNRTTNFPGSRPDVFFVDAGYHYPLDPGMPVVDTDGDGVPDDVEISLAMSDPSFACLDPNDADSDDDGVIDGLDVGGDVDGDATSAACDCDADGDGLTDGQEGNLGSPDADTDTAATCDTSNAPLGCGDPMSSSWTPGSGVETDPLNPDSDGGGEYDGCEGIDFGCIPSTRDANDPNDDDLDRDCLNNVVETSFTLTDPLDADSDDDGVPDASEGNPADFNDGSEPLVCDTDGDGLPDGLEHGITVPVPDPDGPDFPGLGTDLTALCHDSDGDGTPDEPSFIAADPTDPNYRDTHAAVTTFDGGPGRGADTDGDGNLFAISLGDCRTGLDTASCLDGIEDANRDGILQPDGADGVPGTDDDETDPTIADCFAAANLLINGSVTSLTGGGAECGMGTTPPMADLLDGSARCMAIPQPSDYSVTCPAPRVDGAAAGGVVLPWAGLETRVGEAEPGAFDGATGTGVVLVLYEVDNCDQTLMVSKSGSDLLIEGI
jgi:hypothetical protein